jgi:nucleotide-binding universal stress UspA family protein
MNIEGKAHRAKMMDIEQFKWPEFKKVVLVWTRSDDFVSSAEDVVAGMDGDLKVYAVHAMPNESIYSSGAFSFGRGSESAYERELRKEFFEAVDESELLRQAKFEVVFGDRIAEIKRFAEVINAGVILMPRFEQSSFSKWIHGDLNRRIADNAPCSVIFLDACDSKSSDGGIEIAEPSQEMID